MRHFFKQAKAGKRAQRLVGSRYWRHTTRQGQEQRAHGNPTGTPLHWQAARRATRGGQQTGAAARGEAKKWTAPIAGANARS
jgi:hypothetical protein